MNDPFILLAENDYDTELRVRQAFEQNNLLRYLSVVRDGPGALSLLFGGGKSPSVPDVGHANTLIGSSPPRPAPPSIRQEEREVSLSRVPEHYQNLNATGPAGGTSPLPCLLLLDLELPKINGIEILKRIRANVATKELPVVILTSSDEERDVRKSYHLGVNCYLRKPLEFNTLVDSIRQLGLYWLDLDDKFGVAMHGTLK